MLVRFPATKFAGHLELKPDGLPSIRTLYWPHGLGRYAHFTQQKVPGPCACASRQHARHPSPRWKEYMPHQKLRRFATGNTQQSFQSISMPFLCTSYILMTERKDTPRISGLLVHTLVSCKKTSRSNRLDILAACGACRAQHIVCTHDHESKQSLG